MDVVSVVGVVGSGIFLFLTVLPRKPDVPPEKFLPPLHGGYKPRTDPTKNYSKHPPKPPTGKGGGSS